MVIRLLAATALLLAPAGALVTRGGQLEEQIVTPALPNAFSTSERSARSPEAQPIETPTSMRAWLDQTAKANEMLDEEARKVMQELADTARNEADPRARKEQELQMLEDMLKDWDTENKSSSNDISRRVAAIAFRRAIRNFFRRPAKADRRRKPAQDPTPEQVLDAKVDGYLNTWGYEADRTTQDMEKHARTEDSDFGEALPKNAEEETLERAHDLMDGNSPEDGTEMRVTQQRMEADARMEEAARAWVKEAQAQAFSDFAGALVAQGERVTNRTAIHPTNQSMSVADAKMVKAIKSWMAEAHIQRRSIRTATRHESQDLKSWVAQAVEVMRSSGGHEEDNVVPMMREPRGGQSDAHAVVVEFMRSWMAEAANASQDFEKVSRYEESNLREAVPRGQEDKDFEMEENLNDEVDPETASELEELAAAIAQARALHRRLKRRHGPEGGSKENITRVKSALPTSSPDRNRGAPVGEAVKKELKMLEEMWNKYGSENWPAAADDAIEKLDADADNASYSRPTGASPQAMQ